MADERRRRRRGRRQAAAIEGLARVLGTLLPPVYKPFLQSPAPGLTHQQVRTLCSLDPIEPIRVTDLAAKMGIGKSATSIMVSNLVARGLVWKERAIEDRRIVHVRLTPEGERVKEAPTVVDLGKIERMLDEYGVDVGYRIRSFLKRVVSLLLHGDKESYRGVGQLLAPRPFRSPEMPRAPC